MKKRDLFRVGLLLSLLCLLTICAISCGAGENAPATTAPEAPASEEPSFEPTPEVTEPYVVDTASVGVIGDILIHETNYNSARRADGTYDFTENYTLVQPYLSKYDYTVANLEVTLGGEKPAVGRYPSAYPLFNCPDSIVDALKGAGVDLLLTANNHSYDTRTAGMLRTVQVVRDKGLEYLGTRDDLNESFYKVKDLNGIKIGMACFTYSTVSSSGVKALNGITMDRDAGPYVSSFAYNRLDEFYAEAEKAIAEMKQGGAEFIMFYLHWGDEYRYSPNTYQKTIAAKLCELGVDVIVGGHPHVIQPFETITAPNGNETLCIYSTGNAISNQRKFLMDSDNYSGHTEDGMIFGVTFERWSDGKVRLSEVNIEPLWVTREPEGGRQVYRIIPLDLAVSDWHSFALDDRLVADAKASYNRTMALVGTGLNAAREKLGLAPVPVTVS
ncbi:MAG: CapA family protein [Clostridia bacterium]|nr:CapA family protein [Clostridia bacterium]